MGTFDWQLIAVLACVTGALWSVIARFKRLMAGKGGCGDCSRKKPAKNASSEPKLITEDLIEILYKSEKSAPTENP